MTNAQRIHDIYAAFGRGDINAIIEATTEDVDWGLDAEMPAPARWLCVGRGRAKVLEYFKGVGEMMEFHAFVPKLVLGQGNDVLTLVEVEFTGRPTGKLVKSSEAMHFTFNDRGQITRYRLVADTAQLIRAFVR